MWHGADVPAGAGATVTGRRRAVPRFRSTAAGTERFSPQLHGESVGRRAGVDLLEHTHMRAFLLLVAFWAGFGDVAACDMVSDVLEADAISAPDGATLVLSNGEKLRLSGIQAPKLYAPDAALKNWPLADRARALLMQLALDRPISLAPAAKPRDRHDRLIGQAYLADGTWLQREMIAAGLARAYSFPDNRACAGDLLKAEAQARADRRGIWADPFYAVRDAAHPKEILARTGFFELVEGRVLLADKAGATIYLNFGRYWKEDFTVTIDKAAQKLFAASGFDPLSLQGTLIRVRGWVEDHDGPRIAVTHPEQIEVLATP